MVHSIPFLSSRSRSGKCEDIQTAFSISNMFLPSFDSTWLFNLYQPSPSHKMQPKLPSPCSYLIHLRISWPCPLTSAAEYAAALIAARLFILQGFGILLAGSQGRSTSSHPSSFGDDHQRRRQRRRRYIFPHVFSCHGHTHNSAQLMVISIAYKTLMKHTSEKSRSATHLAMHRRSVPAAKMHSANGAVWWLVLARTPASIFS